jgi:hypothetical protein
MHGAWERNFARPNAARALRREYNLGIATRIAALTAVYLAADFFAPALQEGTPPDLFSSAILGILPAQVGLLAIWAALGPGRWHARLLLTTALAAQISFCGHHQHVFLHVSQFARSAQRQVYLVAAASETDPGVNRCNSPHIGRG